MSGEPLGNRGLNPRRELEQIDVLLGADAVCSGLRRDRAKDLAYVRPESQSDQQLIGGNPIVRSGEELFSREQIATGDHHDQQRQ